MLLKSFFVFAGTVLLSLTAAAQQPAQGAIVNPVPPPPQNFTYKKLSSGLQYAFIVDKPTSPKPEEGGQISLNMQSVCQNRILYSTAMQFKGKPGIYGVAKPAYKGDLIEAIMLMTPGDSLVCLLDADALFKNAKAKKPDFIKPGDKVQYFLKLVSLKTKDQVIKEQNAAFQKQMNEQMKKQKAVAAKQALKDDKALKAYFTKNKLTPTKTASGLYYTIKEEGSGEKAMPNDSISMNYTGTLLDGTKFDSNEDTAFHHVAAFQFVLGRGAVIRGWDEGVALLKQGSKATFYIPSGMAYGAQSRPGGGANPKGIPANSILLFDVQLVKVTHPAPPPPPAVKKDSAIAPVPVVPQIDSIAVPKVEEATKKE
ncbi:MAG: FKBP-type peptidyl-prolyl cis-trans isomerase [Bacteroidota bacterium]